MTRGSTSRRTTSGTIGTAALEIIAGPAKGFWLRWFEYTLVAATASVFAIGRPGSKGVTPTAPVAILPEAGGADLGAITATTALAWGTGPTVPTIFYRRSSLPATIGAEMVWPFGPTLPSRGGFTGGGLWVPAGLSIVLWNIAANSLVDVSIVLDE